MMKNEKFFDFEAFILGSHLNISLGDFFVQPFQNSLFVMGGAEG